MFTIRVELHDANWNHYKDLYDRMAAKGFTDTIRNSQGKLFKMQPGEYNWEGNATAEQILELAKGASAATGRNFSVLVSETAWRMWYNLQPVY